MSHSRRRSRLMMISLANCLMIAVTIWAGLAAAQPDSDRGRAATSATSGAMSEERANVDLHVHRVPRSTHLPTTLLMRRSLACVAAAKCVVRTARLAGAGDDLRGAESAARRARPEDDTDLESKASEPRSPGQSARAKRFARATFGEQPLSERVIFRFNIGMGLDGGAPTTTATKLSGLQLDDYAQLRIYAFGDAVIGSRGVLSPSLSTYLASRFRFDQAPRFSTTAIPSVHDAIVQGEQVEDLWIRSAYATWQGVGAVHWLAPLYIRAGRQHRYGPAIAHFDGITLGYDADAFGIGLFSGQAVDLSGLSLNALYADTAVISGLDLRLDLGRLQRVPLSFRAEFLRFDGKTHMRGGMTLRMTPDATLAADLRLLDSDVARSGMQLRVRLSKVTALHVKVEKRTSDDWMYDLFTTVQREEAPLNSLRLGKPAPQWYADARAGTVLLDNIDLLVFAGGALRGSTKDEQVSPHAASYAHAGGAVEVRLRRTVGLGVSLLARRYVRDAPEQADSDDVAGELLVDTNTVGERSFVEGGSTLRYTQGARKFSTSAELYVRYYRVQSSYGDPALFDEPLDPSLQPDVRGGGRFTVEGWAGDNLRLKAEYDLSTELVVAPELRGIKSLRILAEGRF